jgi:hypothetical protein
MLCFVSSIYQLRARFRDAATLIRGFIRFPFVLTSLGGLLLRYGV